MTKPAHFLLCTVILTTIACKARRTPGVEPTHQLEARDVVERFVAWRLEPARIAPPSLESREDFAQTPGVAGTAQLVLAEDAAWNTWPDGTLRLFNNRAAHLFEIDVRPVHGGSMIRWAPDRTLLEVNVEGHALRAAANQEPLLEELVFWAFQQERAVLEGDLVDRARAAGELRRAYVPLEPALELTGLLAFPLVNAPDNEPWLGDRDPSEIHVVSMRLTLALEVDGVPTELVWLLD